MKNFLSDTETQSKECLFKKAKLPKKRDKIQAQKTKGNRHIPKSKKLDLSAEVQTKRKDLEKQMEKYTSIKTELQKLKANKKLLEHSELHSTLNKANEVLSSLNNRKFKEFSQTHSKIPSSHHNPKTTQKTHQTEAKSHSHSNSLQTKQPSQAKSGSKYNTTLSSSNNTDNKANIADTAGEMLETNECPEAECDNTEDNENERNSNPQSNRPSCEYRQYLISEITSSQIPNSNLNKISTNHKGEIRTNGELASFYEAGFIQRKRKSLVQQSLLFLRNQEENQAQDSKPMQKMGVSGEAHEQTPKSLKEQEDETQLYLNNIKVLKQLLVN